MTSGRVEGFLPSTSGMKFTNHFPSGIPIVSIPLPIGRSIPVGDASNGVCGGMVYAAMDLFLAKPRLRVPDTTTSPDGENPLTRYVTRRLVDSFALERGVSSNVARYLRLMSTPDRDSFIVDGVGSVMAHQEWPKVKRDIDAGRPSPLGLVAGRHVSPMDFSAKVSLLGHCHQVLAYAYDVSRRRPADPPRLRPERPAQRHHDHPARPEPSRGRHDPGDRADHLTHLRPRHVPGVLPPRVLQAGRRTGRRLSRPARHLDPVTTTIATAVT